MSVQNNNRNLMAVGTNSSQRPPIPPRVSSFYCEHERTSDPLYGLSDLFSPQRSLTPFPPPPPQVSLDEINAYNKEVARSGGTEFIEEDDLDSLNLPGLQLRSRNVYKRNLRPQRESSSLQQIRDFKKKKSLNSLHL